MCERRQPLNDLMGNTTTTESAFFFMIRVFDEYMKPPFSSQNHFPRLFSSALVESSF